MTWNRYQDRSKAGFVTLNRYQDRSGAGFVTWTRYQDRSGTGFVTWNRYQDRCRCQGRGKDRASDVEQVPGTATMDSCRGQGRASGRASDVSSHLSSLEWNGAGPETGIRIAPG